MTVSLGRLVDINPSTPEFDALRPDEEIVFMPLEACWADGRADLSRRAVRSAVSVGYTRFRRGDVLMPKITPTFEAGRVFPVESPTEAGAGTTELHVLRAKVDVDSRFVAYVCRSQPFLQKGAKSLQGVGNLRRVPIDFIRLFPVVDFSRNRQAAIADFLDRETARIDELIGKQEQLIATLRERRSSVVERTVFAGGNARRLKHAATVSLGKMLDAGRDERAGDQNLPYVRAADVLHDGTVNFIDLNQMPFSEDEKRRLSLRQSDVLIIEGGATVGKPGFVATDVPGVAFQKTINRVRALDGVAMGRYLYWALAALYASGYYSRMYDTVSFMHLTAEKLRDIALPLPTLDRQAEIAAEIDRQTARIDALIGKAEDFITLAKERRSALITAAVTGQIDVREAS